MPCPEYNPYFKTDARLFPALEFPVQLLQHLPDTRAHLVRRYRLYSSRSRGTWSRKPWLVRLAPEGWLQQHPKAPVLTSRQRCRHPWPTPIQPLTLERAIQYLQEDEMVEVTPKSIRLRKTILLAQDRVYSRREKPPG